MSAQKRQKVSSGKSKEDALNAIESHQNEIIALESELQRLRSELEVEYLRKKELVYAKREDDIAHVPYFWAEVLMAHPVSEIFTETDEDVIRYLRRIDVIDQSQGKEREIDYTIKFHFSPNPYFSNTEVWKRWSMTIPDQNDQEAAQEIEEPKTEGSTFIWKSTPEAEALKAQIVTSEPEDEPDDDVEISIFSMFDPNSNALFELSDALHSDIYPDPWSIYNDRVEEVE